MRGAGTVDTMLLCLNMGTQMGCSTTILGPVMGYNGSYAITGGVLRCYLRFVPLLLTAGGGP